MLIRLNLESFRSLDFRLYLFGNAFALQALWIQRITIGWLAWDLSGSATVVGTVAFLTFVPAMISGPFFGVLVDRMPVRRAAQRSQGALSLIALAMAVLFALDLLTLNVLAGAALAIGVAASAQHPIRMSLAPLLAPRGAVASVITLTALNFNVARSVGPAIGGLLIAEWGVGVALWVIFACTLPFQVVLMFLNPRPRQSVASSPAGLWSGLRQGLAHAWSTPLIRRVLVLTAAFTLVGRGMTEILPLIADGLFARGAAGLGVLASAVGIGALGGATAAAALPPPRAGTIPLAGHLAGWGGLAASVLVALSPIWALTIVGVAILGACGTLVGVSMQTTVQQVLSDDLRGRVMSLWVMTAIGGAAIGGLLLGVLADHIGLVSGTLAATVLAAALVVLAAWPART